MFRLRSAAVVTAATATVAVVGMGSAFAGELICPPKEQLSAKASCEDAGGVVIRITNSSNQDVWYLVSSKDNQQWSHSGTAWKPKHDQQARVTDVDLPATKKGDTWKVTYQNGARSDYVRIHDTCPAPKPASTPPSTPPVVHTNPTPPVSAASQPALAHTGADNAPMIAGGAAALLVVGGGTVLFTRRARRNH